MQLQQLTGRHFTWDAFAPVSGSSLCPKFSSSSGSFLSSSCAGHHVWMQPPPTRAAEFISHYLHCKAVMPTSTSGGILLPKWAADRCRSLLSDMRKLHVYHPGYHLFTVASTSGGTRRSAGSSCPVEFWYDPPDSNVDADSNDPFPFTVSKGLSMQFSGKVCCHDASILIDTGSMSSALLSAGFARRIGLVVRAPDASHATMSVTFGDGRSASCMGYAEVPIRLQGYKARLQCAVFDLAPGYDLVLGDPWVSAVGAVLRLHDCSARLLNHPGQPELKSNPFYSVPSANESSAEFNLMQAIREGDEFALCMVSEVHDSPSEVASSPPLTPFAQMVCATIPGETPADLRMRALILDKEGMFPDQLPAELPPDRGLPSVVPLEPGSRPPAQRMFRYSQAERDEIQRQITQLLSQGLIEPSSSPFGAPVLFARKKDGTLRMCVDYRQLNRITVKNRYPLPRIDDLLDRLRGATVFSSLDLTQGYHQILLSEAERERTAFRTPFGHFQYKVMPFGLTNAPAVFQSAMNSILQDLNFVVVYLDDILIFSSSPEEHVDHVRVVLERLQKHRYYCKLSKCEFFKRSVTFLGHVVSSDGVRPDPRKTAVIRDWPTPRNVSELRSFLGLANYFRKFLQGYSSVVAPLTALLSKKASWPDGWDSRCDAAFEQVKQALISAPVLALPDPTQPYEVICDASAFAIGAILLQHGRPIAYESRKLIPAEQNYHTSDRELLAVVHALKVWRCYLEGAKFMVVTDHKPNTSFPTQALLSRRQARWLEFLESFAFDWQYRAGVCNPADPLSRPPGHSQAFAMMVATTRTNGDGASVPEPGVISELTYSIPGFRQSIVEGYASDPWFADAANTRSLQQRDALWWHNHAIVLPAVDSVRSKVLQLCHDHPMSGHAGVTKTVELVLRHFWWPGVRRAVREYVKSCDSCQRVKASSARPGGLLKPLPIPDGKWKVVTMDFITDLPPVNGKNAIYVFVCKLTKMVQLVPVDITITSQQAAKLLFDTVCMRFGLPAIVIHDRDTRFTTPFWKDFLSLLSVDDRASTSFHPQTDGQTERVNRTLEDYLRHYCASDPSNWLDYLPVAEFTLNNWFHESTQSTPFRLMYGYDPATPAAMLARELGGANVRAAPLSDLRNVSAVEFRRSRQDALERAKRCLTAARDRMKLYADKRRSERVLKVGDAVLLSTQHMRLRGPRKLLPRFIGPYVVTHKVNEVAYRLDLPSGTRMHNVFHVSLLRPYVSSDRTPRPPQPDIVDGELEFEVEAILDHREVKHKRHRKRFFLIRWKGQGPEYDSWEPEANLTNCATLLRSYWAAREQPAAPSSQPGVSSKPSNASEVRSTRSGRTVRTPARFNSFLSVLSIVSGVPSALLFHSNGWHR